MEGQMRLGIEIDQARVVSARGNRRPNIGNRRGLADAPFLVDHRYRPHAEHYIANAALDKNCINTDSGYRRGLVSAVVVWRRLLPYRLAAGR